VPRPLDLGFGDADPGAEAGNELRTPRSERVVCEEAPAHAADGGDTDERGEREGTGHEQCRGGGHDEFARKKGKEHRGLGEDEQ
jgi:hypothetical protein